MRNAQGLVNDILGVITKPTRRDKQVKIGPSDIGNVCERCLGMAMVGIPPDGPASPPDHFNLMAWVGTAVHLLLNNRINDERWPGVRQEHKITVGHIKGYGTVTGRTDLYSKSHRTALDFKTASVAKIRKWKADDEVPPAYRAQVNCYGRGLEREDLPVEETCIFFIPRDSMSVNEIWAYIRPYDPAIAKAALKRAEQIFTKFILPGHVELLKSHPTCYQCNSYRRDVTFVG